LSVSRNVDRTYLTPAVAMSSEHRAVGAQVAGALACSVDVT